MTETLAAEPASAGENARPLMERLLWAAAIDGCCGVNELLSRRQASHLVRLRQAVVWVAHERLGRAWTQIAFHMGGREHNGVRHNYERALARREHEPAFVALCGRLAAA